MRYDENYLSEKQEKRVMKFLKEIQKYLKLHDLPDCSVYGLNPEEELSEIDPILEELSNLYEIEPNKKKKKELKKKFKDLKVKKDNLLFTADNRIKIVFPFDDCMEGLMVTIGNDLGIYCVSQLEDSKDGCFTSGVITMSAINSTGTVI